ncbi:MAG: nucleoside triphosphate pyrophosphohydrolase [Spirochaetaceae bacterium]|jgi:tetrapyrrole methylase family protein/MazG family protein|nr:nucleoside triphosphate pyrophosphohydrolase [Spirochaetaceae bacterium]
MKQETMSALDGGAAEAFRKLYHTVVKLRSPEGCPWDREQTPLSLRGDLLEETYECLEAIDEKNAGHIREELGDLFLLATMISYMHEQDGSFTVADALESITEKLIRRHPHVFGGATVKDSAEVLDNWARIKIEQEGRTPKDSLLDGVSTALPVLDRSYKLQKKAAGAGFDWPDIDGIFDKLAEETGEVRATLPPVQAEEAAAAEQREAELGDLLFTVVNLCRRLGVEPSVALQRTNSKFIRRFKYVEEKMKRSGLEMKKENSAVMDRLWNEAKDSEH